MINEHEYLTATWYWTSYAYADEEMAELAWLQLAKVAKRHRGGTEMGTYRHGSPVSGMVLVTALGLKKAGIVMADKVLGAQAYSGFENEPDEVTLEALIARRVRRVAEMDRQGFERGSYELRRERGANLYRDGTMDE